MFIVQCVFCMSETGRYVCEFGSAVYCINSDFASKQIFGYLVVQFWIWNFTELHPYVECRQIRDMPKLCCNKKAKTKDKRHTITLYNYSRWRKCISCTLHRWDTNICNAHLSTKLYALSCCVFTAATLTNALVYMQQLWAMGGGGGVLWEGGGLHWHLTVWHSSAVLLRVARSQ